MSMIIAVCLVLCVPSVVTLQSLNDTIHKLFTTIQGIQIKQDSKLNPPFSWLRQKGAYESDVRLNFHGPEELAFIRDWFSIPDNNMFVSAWVTSCLIEAHGFGRAPKPSNSQIMMALDSVDKYRSKNIPYQNSIMNFWPQIYNSTVGYYQSSPQNLIAVLSAPLETLPVELIEKLLDVLGLKDLETVLERLLRERHVFIQAFHIPPDFDDTFVNLGLGSLLSFFQSEFGQERDYWVQQNSNISSVFTALKDYAYRPFSTNGRINTIDPRTYFYSRTFLERSTAAEKELALAPTWAQDTAEVKKLFSKGVAMPFNINNVDVTVGSNVIFGITSSFFCKLIDPAVLEDEDIQRIYLNTTSLVADQISRNFSSRPDLALTYYPSRYECYWFVSRTYAWLSRFFKVRRLQTQPGFQVFRQAFNILRPVVQTAMTRDIISSAKLDRDGTLYIDDFLGDNDLDFFNRTLVRAEDRIFTTSVAIAALINTWTAFEDGSLLWQDDAPSDVKTTVTKGAAWLNENVFSDQYKPWNAFFSGSGKGKKSMPFPYPSNFREYFNGTTFDDDKFPTDIKNIIGFKGVVSAAEYDAMLKKPHFGMMTPMNFDGYNSEAGGFFPFWSSDAYSYSTALVALSHFQNILN